MLSMHVEKQRRRVLSLTNRIPFQGPDWKTPGELTGPRHARSVRLGTVSRSLSAQFAAQNGCHFSL